MARGSFIAFDSLGSSEGVGFAGSITAPGAEAKTAKFSIGPEHEGVQGERRRGRARLRRGRAARGRRQHPGRLLQGRREERGDVPDDQRLALVGAGRLRERRGRRHDRVARPRLGGDQLGRREDLPRRGRGSGQAPSRGRRLPRGRRARRALRRGGHRGRLAAHPARKRRGEEIGGALEGSLAVQAPAPLRHRSRGRCAARTARPTTSGPRPSPPTGSADDPGDRRNISNAKRDGHRPSLDCGALRLLRQNCYFFACRRSRPWRARRGR